MLLWVSVLVLAPVSGQFEAVPKAVISLHPPWTVFFKGDAVTLTCHVSHIYTAKNRELYQWYLGTEILREIPGNTLKVQNSGEYKCQTQNSLLSDGVTLIFSTAKLILQAPPSVFEGDSVTLKCQANVDLALKNKSLYKNGKMLKILDESSSFHIQQAGLKDNGEYHCAGSEINCSFSSNRIKIQVQELFPHPVLRSRPSWTTSGNQLTLICETQLPPQKSDVQLQFRFFKDGQIVEEGSKNFLKIWNPSSGMNKGPSYYWCEAHTVTSNVCKKSQKSQIHVEVPVSRPVLTLSPPRAQALEGHRVTLHCETRRGSTPILYQFYHGDVLLKSSSTHTARVSFSITLTAESSGKYSCTANNGFGPQRSDTRSLSVTVPASRPILTLRVPGTRAVVGDVMELHCEAHKGSPPILYRFYHDNVFLRSSRPPSGRGTSFNLSLTPEHSGSYACEADNGQGAQRSDTASLRVTVPASRPVLTLRVPGTQAVVGDVMELHCEAHRGSPPILYRFYYDDVFLGSSSAASGGRASFNLSLTPEHSGSYACEADNGLGAQRSEVVSLNVTVPASRPVLTLRVPGTQAVVGDVMELHCEAHRGSPPILYRFYYDDVFLGSSSAASGGRASFNLSLTPEHSGSYACEADNGLGAQRSEVVSLNVTVPASRPILTLRAPGAQAFPGDVMELHCEAHRGSPPILYRFYHDNVILGSSSVPSGGGASFNLSLTEEHTGNYSCEADNGLGAQCSEAVTLSISGLTGSRLGPVATGVAGGLFGMGGLAVVALLLYCRLPRKAGGRTSDPSRNPSNSDPQEPTYYNVPGWIELQPVYSNVNPKGGDVVYSEVRRIQEGNKHAVASDSSLRLLWTYLPSHGPIASPQPYSAQDSSVIYSQVKAESFLTSTAESAHTPCTPSNPGGQRH
ncbi:Fc receptor-like protein 5 isoform X1 [Canis lupus familiaris]|uniref:Fc receptor-like protein 5 isoform X1 n=1 Tax=Canis lupus familiaris TaxID=9615 RepID=UPI0018F40EB0|nr:Fc receptor-like protein 5 isoform X1 [Canis lupus familiaris]